MDAKQSRSKYLHLQDEWIEKYKEGMSFRGIASEYNVSKHTVQSLIKDHVEKRDRSSYSKYRDIWYKMYVEQGYSSTEIANRYNTSAGVVMKQLRATGFELDKPTFGPSKKFLHLLDSWKEQYHAGQSLSEIAEQDGASIQTVSNYLSEAGVDLRDYSEASRLYPVDESYFDVIDSPEKAYWLGWVFSSGSLAEHISSVSLNFSVRERDLDRLIAFRNALKTEKPWRIEEPKRIYHLRIQSRPLYDRLVTLGLRQDKYRTLVFPSDLPKEYMRPFLRGYIEGKGSYSDDSLTITGATSFLNEVRTFLEDSLGISLMQKGYPDENSPMGRLVLYRKKDYASLFDWLYQDAIFYSENIKQKLSPS